MVFALVWDLYTLDTVAPNSLVEAGYRQRLELACSSRVGCIKG